MLKKTHDEVGLTLALLAYHDTPISDTLPCPAELLFNRRTNSRLAPVPQETILSDQQRADLTQKRSAHIKKTTRTEEDFMPSQAIWFTEDHTSEWKPGYVESKDLHPDSYWIVNENNNRRIRRNKHDLKPRFPIAPERHCDKGIDVSNGSSNRCVKGIV